MHISIRPPTASSRLSPSSPSLKIILFTLVPPLKMDKIYHPTPPQKTPLKTHWPQRSEV